VPSEAPGWAAQGTAALIRWLLGDKDTSSLLWVRSVATKCILNPRQAGSAGTGVTGLAEGVHRTSSPADTHAGRLLNVALRCHNASATLGTPGP
jgi:hypothetical protein